LLVNRFGGVVDNRRRLFKGVSGSSSQSHSAKPLRVKETLGTVVLGKDYTAYIESAAGVDL
jgi:hypothetical protein